jgi:hypothetical protein
MHFSSDLVAKTMQHKFCMLNTVHLVLVGGSSTSNANDSLHISVIHAFCESMLATIKSRPDQPIVVCPEDQDIVTACQLCGAFLLLCGDRGLEHVLSAFQDALQGSLAARRTAIVDSWTSLHRARALGWLGSSADDDEHTPCVLDVEMASHYALARNGFVHVLVPGKLLLFPAPAPLSADQAWVDVSEPGRPAARRFSAAFLAALLSDLGVSAVACLGRTGGSDAAALRAGGLDVHDLALDARRPALLGAMDHLLAVSRRHSPISRQRLRKGASAGVRGDDRGDVAGEGLRLLRRRGGRMGPDALPGAARLRGRLIINMDGLNRRFQPPAPMFPVHLRTPSFPSRPTPRGSPALRLPTSHPHRHPGEVRATPKRGSWAHGWSARGWEEDGEDGR